MTLILLGRCGYDEVGSLLVSFAELSIGLVRRSWHICSFTIGTRLGDATGDYHRRGSLPHERLIGKLLQRGRVMPVGADSEALGIFIFTDLRISIVFFLVKCLLILTTKGLLDLGIQRAFALNSLHSRGIDLVIEKLL